MKRFVEISPGVYRDPEFHAKALKASNGEQVKKYVEIKEAKNDL